MRLKNKFNFILKDAKKVILENILNQLMALQK